MKIHIVDVIKTIESDSTVMDFADISPVKPIPIEENTKLRMRQNTRYTRYVHRFYDMGVFKYYAIKDEFLNRFIEEHHSEKELLKNKNYEIEKERNELRVELGKLRNHKILYAVMCFLDKIKRCLKFIYCHGKD
jgi:hypothetical protein